MTEPQPVASTEVAPDETKAAEPVEVRAEEPPTQVEDTKSDETPADEDEVDEDTEVLTCLERETQDGKGGDDVPESDFVSHATEGVNKEDES